MPWVPPKAQLGIDMQKGEADPYLTLCLKVNSNWITDLNGRAETLQLEKENTEDN